MDVYLVRHAEDVAAAESRFGDTPLSSLGRRQARVLAEELRDISFDVCVCSPLVRAVETAKEVLKVRTLEPEIAADFREGDLGALDGFDDQTARARFPEAFRLGRSIGARLAAVGTTAPEGESRADFLARASRAADRVRALLAGTGENALIVSHGGLLNAALGAILDRAPDGGVPFGFDHAGWVRLIAYAEAPGFGPFPMLRFRT